MGSTVEAEAEILAAANLAVRAAIVSVRASDAVAAWMAARDPDALARLEAAPTDGWVRLADHVLMVDALGEVVGIDQLRSFSRRRMRDRAPGTITPMVVQAWTRSFAGDPAAIVRLASHLWRNMFRNAGRMVETRGGIGEIVVRFEDSPLLASSAAWREYICGLEQGIQDIAGNDVEVDLHVLDAQTVETRIWWVAATSSATP